MVTDTVQLRTGSTQLQGQVDFAMSVGSSLANFGTSVAVGFATGNVAGAVIGGAMSLVNTGLSYAKATKCH